MRARPGDRRGDVAEVVGVAGRGRVAGLREPVVHRDEDPAARVEEADLVGHGVALVAGPVGAAVHPQDHGRAPRPRPAPGRRRPHVEARRVRRDAGEVLVGEGPRRRRDRARPPRGRHRRGRRRRRGGRRHQHRTHPPGPAHAPTSLVSPPRGTVPPTATRGAREGCARAPRPGRRGAQAVAARLACRAARRSARTRATTPARPCASSSAYRPLIAVNTSSAAPCCCSRVGSATRSKRKGSP